MIMIFLGIINKAVNKFGGRKAKNIFKECIISFASVENEIDCALEIQKRLNESNNGTQGEKGFTCNWLDIGSPVSDSSELFEDSIQLLKHLQHWQRWSDNIIIFIKGNF